MNVTWKKHWTPRSEVNDVAVARALDAVSAECAVAHLIEYYSRESDYAGSTFLGLGPHHPDELSAGDLLATTTLSVAVGPHAVRNLVGSPSVATALRALDPAWRLEDVTPAEVVEAMAELYALFKGLLSQARSQAKNPWVTASKLCARKRPHLFPVRDVVSKYLGLPRTYPVDWPAFQAVMSNEQVLRYLDDHVGQAAATPDVEFDALDQRLRHLDVVLWMHASSHGPPG